MRLPLQLFRKKIFRLAAFLLATLPLHAQAQQASPAAVEQAPVVEQGKFVLHKFQQAIGEETYEFRRNASGETDVRVNFKFTDRGTAVPLTATYRAAADGTPESFAIQGRSSRLSGIDDAVEVGPQTVKIRQEKETREEPRPRQFFTIAGYSPATMQMLMVRYWKSHGLPASLKVFPRGEVKITPRGSDVFAIGGQSRSLSRFTVEGLIWGRETLWIDSEENLVALISVDAEFDHFEAVREEFEPALATFISRAGADGMAALAEIGKSLPGSRQPRLALVGGTLVDGTGAPAVPDAVVLIESGRIVAAGPRSRVKIPKGAAKFDAMGMTILPGLWDMHAHFEQVEWGPVYLAAGATTVRDCGNELQFITAVRDAIRDAKGLGPRILAAGIVDGDSPVALGIQRVNSPENARRWVDLYHDRGFEQIKIYSSVKLENLKAVAEEAHRLGMTVTGHVPDGITTYQAVEAGQDQINHLQYVVSMVLPESAQKARGPERAQAVANLDLALPEAQKAIEFLKSHGTVLDPTMAIFEMITAGPGHPLESFEPGVKGVAPELGETLKNGGVPEQFVPLAEQAFAKELQLLGALHKAGIPIVAGTDQAVPGHSLHREIELYTEAGFTPLEAIQAATIVPARVMKLEKELGTVEAGKRADVILVQGNPLDNIHNIRNVKYVVTGGALYDCAALWRVAGFQR